MIGIGVRALDDFDEGADGVDYDVDGDGLGDSGDCSIRPGWGSGRRG